MRKAADFILNGSFREGDQMRAVDFGDVRAGSATNPMVTAYLARTLIHPGMQGSPHSSQGNSEDAPLFRASGLPVFTFLRYDPELRSEEPRRGTSLGNVSSRAALAVRR